MNTHKFPFINWPHGELSSFNIKTPIGLYLYRYLDYFQLLNLTQKDLPKIEGAVDENKNFFQDSALRQVHSLGAILLGMHVVAFEDYLRQQISALLTNQNLIAIYPNNRWEPDHYGDYLKISKLDELNRKFNQVFNFELIEEEHIPQIHDLVKIRNIIFHFGGFVNQEIRERFDFYTIDRDFIDVTYGGVKDLSKFMYERVSHIDKQIRVNILRTIRDAKQPHWKDDPLIREMIVHLHYFGHIAELRPGMTAGALTDEQKQELEGELLQKCFKDIENY